MDKILTIDELKVIAKMVAEKHGLKKVVLFGSYANGSATKKSDVDFIIDFKEGSSPTYFDLFDVRESFEHAIGRKIDLISSSKLLKDSYLIIDKEVPLYELW